MAASNIKTTKRGKKLHEGKAKIIYSSSNKNHLIMYFKDDATAFNGLKKGIIVNKGIINNLISTHIFKMLEKKGVKTHFVDVLSDREMIVKSTKIIPVEVVMRNVVAGSLSKRMGLKEGTMLKRPILEFYYKDDDLHDPMINENHILVFNLATPKQLEKIKEQAFTINKILVAYFKKHNIRLIDYKLEFGVSGNTMYLADEITPDGCRLWDFKTNKKLDKDRFRRDLGKVEESYEEVYKRLLGEKFKK